MITSSDRRINNAASTAAAAITRDLRQYLVSLGWTNTAASAVSVHYSSAAFKVKITGTHKKEAEIFEYGTESQRPTAGIRKYLNRDQAIQEIYFDMLEDALGEII